MQTWLAQPGWAGAKHEILIKIKLLNLYLEFEIVGKYPCFRHIRSRLDTRHHHMEKLDDKQLRNDLMYHNSLLIIYWIWLYFSKIVNYCNWSKETEINFEKFY